MIRVIIALCVLVAILVWLFISLYNRSPTCRNNPYVDPHKRLAHLHSQLRLKYGTFRDEYPEQVMAAMYIRPDDVVLELGGNIGRNTLIIGKLLCDDRNLMSLETDPDIAKQLAENRELNQMNFQIVCAALSARPLVQEGWVTQPWDGRPETIPENHQPVNTIRFDQLQERMGPNKPFSTLVADCEGALFYILKDFPDMLKTFRTVIMENDYNDMEHKQFVDHVLTQYGFKCVYRKAGGWGPCEHCFFEVWCWSP